MPTAKKPMKKRSVKNGNGATMNCTMMEVGNYIIIKKERPKKNGATTGIAKRLTRPPAQKIANPSTPIYGCHLAGSVYDHDRNETTFLYECDRVMNHITGATWYKRTVPGRPAS